MAVGTVMPSPVFEGWDDNGDPLNGGLLYTYVAGTSTPQTTYSDVTLLVANANPVVLNSAGRATVFLPLGTTYKFVLKTSAGVTIWTQDNIANVPSSSANLDITGTAGETLTAGQVVYLSDGSGSKTAGQWFTADADNTYSSSAATIVGIVPNAIASGASGTIRIAGSVTGLTGLTTGTTYYISATAGALTATAPANARLVGEADSTTSIVIAPNPPPSSNAINNTIASGRLTLTSGTPVTVSDVTGATTIYYTPYNGNVIALYNGSTAWNLITFTETSQALGTLTSGLPYDVFGYNNSGTLALELLAWTNATTRATALTYQNGVLVKTGATTRRWLGTFQTTSTTQTEDSYAKRLVYNAANRVLRPMRVVEATNSWAYTTAAFRQANGSTANQLAIMNGYPEEGIEVTAIGSSRNDNANISRITGIGEDSTSTPHTSSLYALTDVPGIAFYQTTQATLRTIPAVGGHYYAWLEYSAATGTTTWVGDNGGTLVQTGITGMWKA